MFEGLFQPLHLIVIFLVALVVFGPKKLPEFGKGLGEAIRGFKKALDEEGTSDAVKPSQISKSEDEKKITG
jgi:sec-independent protein translocase protein TatA